MTCKCNPEPETEREKVLFEIIRILRRSSIRCASLYVRGSAASSASDANPNIEIPHEPTMKRFTDALLLSTFPSELTRGVLLYAESKDLEELIHADSKKAAGVVPPEPDPCGRPDGGMEGSAAAGDGEKRHSPPEAGQVGSGN